MNEVSGGYAQINLYGNMTLNNATLRVIGYIKGTGTITANNSTVIENMFLVGWTGGTVATAKYSGGCNALSVYTSPNSVNDNPKVFPFSQYELRSIQTKLVLNYGSKLQGYAKVTTGALSVSFITIEAQANESYIDLITSSSSANGGLIRMTASGSSVIKTFANGRVALRLNGTFSDGCLGMALTVLGKSASLSSEKVFFAIDGRIDITLTSGSTLTQSYKLKFMPGATVTIENGATYTLNGSSIFYTSEFVDCHPSYYPGAERGDSRFIVNGTFNLNGSFGGVISSTSNGGKVVVGSSATLSVTSIEGTGARDGLNFVFTEEGTVTKSATLSNGTAVATGTTYTYNGSTWA